jgi:hypothetical protein
MANQYVYQVYCDYISHNGMRVFDFKNKDTKEHFSDMMDERLEAILKNHPGWDISSHSITLVQDVLLLTIIFRKPVADYLASV